MAATFFAVTAVISSDAAHRAQIRPSVYSEADRLVQLWERNEKEGFDLFSVSTPNFLDWKEQNQVFEQMAAYREKRLRLRNRNNREEQILAVQVTPNLFEMLGVAPASGRALSAGEQGSSRVVVVSDSLWRRRYDADPSLVGKTLALDGVDHTVIGIMPPGYDFPLHIDLPGNSRGKTKARQADLWVPFKLDDMKEGRGARLLRVIARLRAGVTLEQAQSEMNTIARSLESRYPQTNSGWGVAATALSSAKR